MTVMRPAQKGLLFPSPAQRGPQIPSQAQGGLLFPRLAHGRPSQAQSRFQPGNLRFPPRNFWGAMAELPAPPWLPELPAPAWLPELPDPPLRPSLSPSCTSLQGARPPPRWNCYGAGRHIWFFLFLLLVCFICLRCVSLSPRLFVYLKSVCSWFPAVSYIIPCFSLYSLWLFIKDSLLWVYSCVSSSPHSSP